MGLCDAEACNTKESGKAEFEPNECHVNHVSGSIFIFYEIVYIFVVIPWPVDTNSTKFTMVCSQQFCPLCQKAMPMLGISALC